MRRILGTTFTALTLGSGCLCAAEAQTITGRIMDAEGSGPVSGAIVKSLDAEGRATGGILTNDAGEFSFAAPANPPAESVTIERIGFATLHLPLADVTGPEPADLTLSFAPIGLGEIVVSAETSCGVDARSGGSLQAVWDEARKSLEIAALSQAQNIHRYETETFDRDLDPASGRRLRDNAENRFVSADYPFLSISLEQMRRQGWVETAPDGAMRFFAPDASVLLSDEFAGMHCFRGETTRDSVFLHFTPNDERQSVPELEGTLVLDAETAELTHLRFDYVGLPDRIPEGVAGGEIDFARAPNGLRIVREWSIRAPVVSYVRSGAGSLAAEETRLEYIREEGGRVIGLQTNTGTVWLADESADLAAAGAGLVGDEFVAATRTLNRGVADLLLRNNSDHPYRVTQVRLRDCQNTAVPCGEYPMDVLITPGETAMLMRLRPARSSEAFVFDWSYSGISIVEFQPGLISANAAAPERLSDRYDPDVITNSQIPENRFSSVEEALSTLRPNWLRPRGFTSFLAVPEIGVYLDNVYWGTTRSLGDLSPEMVERIEWFDAPTATLRWGTGHPYGAILITSRGRSDFPMQ